MIYLHVDSNVLEVELQNNSSSQALVDLLKKGSIEIEMEDYAQMEKVGPLPIHLPQNNKQIQAQPRDVILYQGKFLVIYYKPNAWNFTKLGKISNITDDQLIKLLKKDHIQMKISL